MSEQGRFFECALVDGRSMAVYESTPPGDAPPRGGLLILQEIFGINRHIREVADGYAADGWHVLAPALFDREDAGTELEYDAAGRTRGIALKQAVDALAEADILAARGHIPDELVERIAVIGYCWGGSLAWRMATAYDGFAAAIAYYGGQLPALKDRTPRCPVMAHFGRDDASIPLDGVEAFMQAHPELPCHIHAAGHGFNCDLRAEYNEAAATAARQQSAAFLAEHVA